MSTVNTATLLTKLTSLATRNYDAGSTVVDDVLATALSVELLNETNQLTVASVDALPNLQYFDSPSGMVYFITSLEIFAVSSGSKWLGLDGRLIREDAAYSKMFTWGCNCAGQLGDNTIINRAFPDAVIIGLTDWCQVNAGLAHTFGIRTNGSLWAWGNGDNGRLGDGTTTSRRSPVSVIGGFTDWCQVSAGIAHSLGVRTNGTAWAWGINSAYHLGDGTSISRLSPVLVAGGFTDWCQVSAGSNHSHGIRTDGTLWAWGYGAQGRLGTGSTANRSSPTSVVGGFTDWCQVSAGNTHSVAIRTNGTAWAWGGGLLGDGTAVGRSSPVLVAGGFTDWCQVSVGRGHSLGVRANGTLWAWGYNSFGQLGTGATSASILSPVSVIGGFTDWCQASAGCAHSLGVRSNGTLWAWGYNTGVLLGDGTTTAKSSPVSVIGGFTDWCQVDAGWCHSIGIRSR